MCLSNDFKLYANDNGGVMKYLKPRHFSTLIFIPNRTVSGFKSAH